MIVEVPTAKIDVGESVLPAKFVFTISKRPSRLKSSVDAPATLPRWRPRCQHLERPVFLIPIDSGRGGIQDQRACPEELHLSVIVDGDESLVRCRGSLRKVNVLTTNVEPISSAVRRR